MSNSIVIAVDAMGGDFGPSVVVPGAFHAGRHLAEPSENALLTVDKTPVSIKLLLVGKQEEVEAVLATMPEKDKKGVEYEIVHCTEVVEMDEKPSDILRRKKDSSIQVSCRLVKEETAHALVSAGHSGAAVACGMFILGRIPGVERPALATILPTEKNPMLLLDVGANVECKPQHLFQFAIMGSTFAKTLLGYENPRVGILSIGEEEGKGNALVKSSYELLKMAQNINFIGNAEGRDMFTGNVEVIVCDGFVGNVALKLSEGLGMSFSRVLKRELLGAGFVSKMGALLSKKGFKSFAKVMDYAEYGGAPLLGLQGVAIVSHGASNEKAISSAVSMAARYVGRNTHKHLVEAIGANDELTRYARSVVTGA